MLEREAALEIQQRLSSQNGGDKLRPKSHPKTTTRRGFRGRTEVLAVRTETLRFARERREKREDLRNGGEGGSGREERSQGRSWQRVDGWRGIG